jgi:hypothetical protein
MTDFRPQLILEALDRHGVEYIIVGGLAANMLGSDRITGDMNRLGSLISTVATCVCAVSIRSFE